MDRAQIDRLRDTLDSLVQIRSSMEHCLTDLSATQAEMQDKLSQAKRNDVPGAEQRLLHILKQQTSQMSQSLDQVQHDNQNLTTAVKTELYVLLQKSSKQMDRISSGFASGPNAETQPVDKLLAVALLHQADDNDMDDGVALDADEVQDESNVSDAHDLTGEQVSQNSFSID